MNARRLTRKTLPQALAACANWIEADRTQWTDEESRRYERHKELIEKYLRGERMGDALQAYRFSYEQLLRSLNRCVALAEDGRLFGWRALVPYCHTAEYTRHAPVRAMEASTQGGYAGALGALFNHHPAIQEDFDAYLLKGKRHHCPIQESRVELHVAHKYFLSLCKGVVLEHQWPFCTQRLGAGAIGSYAHAFWLRHYDEVVERQYGEKAKAKSKTGTGHRSRLIATLPYDIVELDEHKAHFLGSIGIPSPKGLRWCPIRRVTIILVVDRVSGVVLGYSVTFRREARARDVTLAISRAVGPTALRTLSLDGLSYPDGAGFPSGSIDGCARCGWNMLLIDNALSHYAHEILGRVRETVGCAMNFGAIRRFERRSIAELVFKELSRIGFHRILSTTGSHSQDPRRRDAERAAAKFRMSMDAILDLIEMVVAEYNTRKGKMNCGIGGLDYLRQMMSDHTLGFLSPSLPQPADGDVPLHLAIEKGRIAGSKTTGVRPYIQLDEVPYTNPDLAGRWDLIGTPIYKHIDEANVQCFDACLADGTPLGTVDAQGRWGNTPHSREARRQINALIRSGELILQRGEDPVVAWLQALADAAAVKNRHDRKPKVSDEASQIAEEVRQTAVAIPEAETEKSPDTSPPILSTSEGAAHAPIPQFSVDAVN